MSNETKWDQLRNYLEIRLEKAEELTESNSPEERLYGEIMEREIGLIIDKMDEIEVETDGLKGV